MNQSVLEEVRELSKQFDLKDSILYLAVVLERSLDQQSVELDGVRDAIVDAGMRIY